MSARRDHKPNDTSRPTVLCVPETLGNGSPNACAYLRLVLPLTKAIVDNHWRVRFASPARFDVHRAEVLVTQRLAFKSITDVERLLRHRDAHGTKLIYDLDDDLLALDAAHDENEHYSRMRPIVLRMLAEADCVWTSTASLAERVRVVTSNVTTIQNRLDPRVWKAAKPTPARKDELRLLYMGTATHGTDFAEVLKPALEKLRAILPQRVSATLIGVLPTGAALDGWTATSPAASVGSSYPAFVHWLSQQGPFDIGLAPLTPSPFNQSKSHLKFLEYSAMGLATIASDIGEYRETIRHGVNGWLAGTSAADMVEALHTLARDATRRGALAERASADLAESLDREEAAEPRLGALESIISANSVPPSSSQRFAASRLGSAVERQSLARTFLAGEGIEVGALHNPLAVSSEARVRYVDRMTRDALFEHYPELRGHNLVNVDIVDDGERLGTLAADSQDFIIANHFIEHCQDPIRTLRAFLRVLRPGGVIFMAVPDMRTTFDKNRALTTLEHLERDHLEGPHTSRAEHFGEWVTLVEPHFGRSYDEQQTRARVNELSKQDYSIHFHTFTPESFASFIAYCRDKAGLPVRTVIAVEFEDEMIFILRRTAASMSSPVHAQPDVRTKAS